MKFLGGGHSGGLTPKHIFSKGGIQTAALDKLRSIVSRFTASSAASRNGSLGAFYVFSPPRVHASLNLWRTQLPDISPYYAVKCNPEPNLMNALHDAGTNFDCASERELLEVKALARGTLSSRVIYANPCKSRRDLAAAKDMGAPTTVVDSVEEVEKLQGYEGGALIRIAVDDTSSAMPFSTKFGCCALEDVQLIADAAAKLHVPLRGISFHVGSGCGDGVAYGTAIRRAYEALGIVRKNGHQLANMLDIGGGFLPEEADFRRKAIHIRGAYQEVNLTELDTRRESLRWIAEPGRYFATKAFDFFVQVIGKKASAAGWKYTLDDSLYGQFSSILFDYAQPSWVRVEMDGGAGAAKRKSSRSRGPGVLFGRTCDSVDVIARAESMEELEVGDWLWFPAMGAYTRATASEFNGFPTPPVLVASGLPEPNLSAADFHFSTPRGVTRMPPVSARAFWAAGLPGKN